MSRESTRIASGLRRALTRLGAVSAQLAAIDHEGLAEGEWLRVRARIGNLVADFNDSVADVDRALGTGGAQTRILKYLKLRVGEVVTKDELSGVAGIHEWARRVRELRVDHGWPIHSATTRPNLHPGEYILVSGTPDEALARDWAIAKQMSLLRTHGGRVSYEIRILEFLKAIHPRSADREQLAYVAGSGSQSVSSLDELSRRGWTIAEVVDHEGGGTGQYRLLDIDPASRPT